MLGLLGGVHVCQRIGRSMVLQIARLVGLNESKKRIDGPLLVSTQAFFGESSKHQKRMLFNCLLLGRCLPTCHDKSCHEDVIRRPLISPLKLFLNKCCWIAQKGFGFDLPDCSFCEYPSICTFSVQISCRRFYFFRHVIIRFQIFEKDSCL